MRSPIWWFGGKGKLIGRLLQFIPLHDAYIEPFLVLAPSSLPNDQQELK